MTFTGQRVGEAFGRLGRSVGDAIMEAATAAEGRARVAEEKERWRELQNIEAEKRTEDRRRWLHGEATTARTRAEDLGMQGLGVTQVPGPEGGLVGGGIEMALAEAEAGKPVGTVRTSGRAIPGTGVGEDHLARSVPQYLVGGYSPENDYHVQRATAVAERESQARRELAEFYMKEGFTPTGQQVYSGDGTGSAQAGRSLSVEQALDYLLEADTAAGITRPYQEYFQAARMMAAGRDDFGQVLSAGEPVQPQADMDMIRMRLNAVAGALEGVDPRQMREAERNGTVEQLYDNLARTIGGFESHADYRSQMAYWGGMNLQRATGMTREAWDAEYQTLSGQGVPHVVILRQLGPRPDSMAGDTARQATPGGSGGARPRPPQLDAPQGSPFELLGGSAPVGRDSTTFPQFVEDTAAANHGDQQREWDEAYAAAKARGMDDEAIRKPPPEGIGPRPQR